jgi:hypothetical protein
VSAPTAPPSAPAAPPPRERTNAVTPPAVAAAAAAVEESPAPEEAAEPEPAAPTPAPMGPLRLEAITQNNDGPVAVINGQVVRVGDRIGASTVVRIGVAEVEIETDGLRRVLRF